MTITYHKGDILTATTDHIVIPINCGGVFGVGLAKQFKLKHSTEYNNFMYGLSQDYVSLYPGSIYIRGRFIFATTKGDWKEPSKMGWIVSILWYLRETEGSTALPPLGCGLGGLDPGEFCVLAKWFFAGCKNSYEIWDTGGLR